MSIWIAACAKCLNVKCCFNENEQHGIYLWKGDPKCHTRDYAHVGLNEGGHQLITALLQRERVSLMFSWYTPAHNSPVAEG